MSDADSVTGRFLTIPVEASDVFTREDLDPQQQLLGAAAAEFVARDVLPGQPRILAQDWTLTRDLLRKAGALDLLRVELPREYDGLALDRVSAAWVMEQFAIVPSFAASVSAHVNVGSLPLQFFGTPEQKARYLPRIARADLVAAFALTETEAGSDALGLRTRADLSGDGTHYVLNGQKAWVTNGAFADLFTIIAKVDGERFTAFLVERNMGVESGPGDPKLGLDGSSTTPLLLSDVRVPVENVLGQVGQGHRIAFNVLNVARVKLGVRNMRAARLALQHAAQYAQQRRQFGRPIGSFGMIRAKLGEMAVRCYIGDAMVYRTLGDIDRTLAAADQRGDAGVLGAADAFAPICSINKVWTSEAQGYVVDEAVQIFGANGYSRDFPVERGYRDARITRIYEGTNEVHRTNIPMWFLKRTPALFANVRDGTDARTVPTGAAFAGERALVAGAKQVAVDLLAHARATYGDTLREEQEILGSVADILIEAYALESGLARAAKALERDVPTAGLAADIAQVYAGGAACRIANAAAPVVRALDARGTGPRLNEKVSARVAYMATDTISARRRIADAVLQAGGHPF